MPTIKSQYTFILILLIFTSCAISYNKINPESETFFSSLQSDSIDIWFKYDVLKSNGNFTLSKKVDNYNLDLLAIRILNKTKDTLHYCKDIKLSITNDSIQYITANKTDSLLLQLLSNKFLATKKTKNAFLKNLEDFSIDNKTIAPYQHNHALVIIHKAPFDSISLKSFKGNLLENNLAALNIKDLNFSDKFKDYDIYFQYIISSSIGSPRIVNIRPQKFLHNNESVESIGLLLQRQDAGYTQGVYKIGTWRYYNSLGKLIKVLNYNVFSEKHGQCFSYEKGEAKPKVEQFFCGYNIDNLPIDLKPAINKHSYFDILITNAGDSIQCKIKQFSNSAIQYNPKGILWNSNIDYQSIAKIELGKKAYTKPF